MRFDADITTTHARWPSGGGVCASAGSRLSTASRILAVRVTIINPYDRADEIARNAIDWLAAQLARLVNVRLVRPHTEAGATFEAEVVVSTRLDAVVLGEGADAVICPADQVLVHERAGGGRGRDSAHAATPRPCRPWGRRRRSRLRGDHAGGMRWPKLREPRARGRCTSRSASHRRSARSSTPMDERGLTVTACTHEPASQRGRGSRGGARSGARGTARGAEILVFGNVPGGWCDAVPSVTRNSAADLGILRSGAVHVAAAREDAVGAIGALSLAAGSALVSTATAGAADYVVPDLTAMVTPVGDPDTLAASVVSLLDDPWPSATGSRTMDGTTSSGCCQPGRRSRVRVAAILAGAR